MNRTLWLGRVAVLATALGCARIAAAHVTVADAWVRGTVEGQTATAAYMSLHSDAATRLVSIASAAAARCGVHEMTMTEGVMRMRALDSLAIAVGGTVELKEGGDHIMLEGLTRTLKEGDAVTLTLTFVDSAGQRSTVDVQAPVLPLGALHHTMPVTR